jgi:hypothetical protein
VSDRPSRRRLGGLGSTTTVVVATVGVTAVVIVLMAVSGMGPTVVLAPLGLLAVAACWLVSDLGNRAVPTDGVAPSAALPPPARVDHRLMTLRNGIAYGRPDDASTDRLRAALVDLVDDQLLAVHGIDRHVDPHRAATVMGATLAAFVDDPALARRLTKPRDLDRIVTLIEQL